jgi:hypothetical protein
VCEPIGCLNAGPFSASVLGFRREREKEDLIKKYIKLDRRRDTGALELANANNVKIVGRGWEGLHCKCLSVSSETLPHFQLLRAGDPIRCCVIVYLIYTFKT